MPPETSAATPPAKRRRWYQFSLSTLIGATTLVSVLLGGLTIRLERARRQGEAVATIRKSGGWVKYDYECRVEDDLLILEPSAKSDVPAWLLNALGKDFFHDVVGVDPSLHLDKELPEAQRQEVGQAINGLKATLKWPPLLVREYSPDVRATRGASGPH